MHFKGFLLAFTLARTLLPSLACEDECMDGVVKAFISNYSTPVHDVLYAIGDQMIQDMLLTKEKSPAYIMEPIYSAYSDSTFDLLKKAIFPSYFHGKCQRFSKDGTDPPGCPNPDCPVVCGTPGSMAHFYSTLRYIAFNSTKTTLEALVIPGNPAYEETYRRVEKLMQGPEKREKGDVDTEASEMLKDAFYDTWNSTSHQKTPRSMLAHEVNNASKNKRTKRSTPTPPTVASSLARFDNLFDKACGGNARDSPDGLPKCSWEKEMKSYILTFP